MKINFFETTPGVPVYTVDFADFHQEERQSSLSVVALARAAFAAIYEAGRETLFSATKSFKAVVLPFSYSLFCFVPFAAPIALPKSFHMFALKLLAWIASEVASAFFVSVRLFVDKVDAEKSSALLEELMPLSSLKEIDPQHCKTAELELDASAVPQEINLQLLQEFFSKIDCTDENSPDYFPASLLREDGDLGTIEEIRKGTLQTFINNVTRRVPFIGTPRADKPEQLEGFYHQIESAVRLVLYRITKNVQEFEARCGFTPHQTPEERKALFASLCLEDQNTYRHLLGDRSRFVRDLSFAGAHCGGRYMGEAMSSYVYFCQEAAEERTNSALQDSLESVLALKRRDVAQAQIIRSPNRASPHFYNEYMSKIGPLVGLPGTKNISEPLPLANFDLAEEVKRFFKAYTPDVIIETVQEKFKLSQAFREQIYDWIKLQVKGWKQEEYQEKSVQWKAKIQEVLERKENWSEGSLAQQGFETVQRLLQHLIETKALQDSEDGELLLEDLFASETAKKWLDDHLFSQSGATDTVLEKRKRVEFLKRCCGEELLGKELLLQLQRAVAEGVRSGLFVPLASSVYAEHFKIAEEIAAVRKILPMEEETVLRVIQGKAALQEVVQAYAERERQQEFLENFFRLVEDFSAEKGWELSPELMEWLLVSHHILKPLKEFVASSSTPANIDAEKLLTFYKTLWDRIKSDPERFIAASGATPFTLAIRDHLSYPDFLSVVTGGASVGSNFLRLVALHESASQRGKRYRFAAWENAQVVERLFEKVFQSFPEEFIAAAEQLEGGRFRSLLQRASLTVLSKPSASLLSFALVRVVSLLALWALYSKALAIASPLLLASRVVTLIDQQVSVSLATLASAVSAVVVQKFLSLCGLVFVGLFVSVLADLLRMIVMVARGRGEEERGELGRRLLMKTSWLLQFLVLFETEEQGRLSWWFVLSFWDEKVDGCLDWLQEKATLLLAEQRVVERERCLQIWRRGLCCTSFR